MSGQAAVVNRQEHRSGRWGLQPVQGRCCAPPCPAATALPADRRLLPHPSCRQRQFVILGNRVPTTAPDTWVAPNAVVVGDVDLYERVREHQCCRPACPAGSHLLASDPGDLVVAVPIGYVIRAAWGTTAQSHPATAQAPLLSMLSSPATFHFFTQPLCQPACLDACLPSRPPACLPADLHLVWVRAAG